MRPPLKLPIEPCVKLQNTSQTPLPFLLHRLMSNLMQLLTPLIGSLPFLIGSNWMLIDLWQTPLWVMAVVWETAIELGLWSTPKFIGTVMPCKLNYELFKLVSPWRNNLAQMSRLKLKLTHYKLLDFYVIIIHLIIPWILLLQIADAFSLALVTIRSKK